jgi:hypothetical protein
MSSAQNLVPFRAICCASGPHDPMPNVIELEVLDVAGDGLDVSWEIVVTGVVEAVGVFFVIEVIAKVARTRSATISVAAPM